MSNNMIENDKMNMTNQNEAEKKKEFLLNQDNFELLMNVQREIEEATEMRPTFKKLINMLVTEESLNNVRKIILTQMN